MNDEIETLWRVQDVARFLRVSTKAVYKARSDQGLPAIMIGGQLRFLPSSVHLWAAEQESTEGAKAKAGRPQTMKRVVGRRVHEQEVPQARLLA